MAVFDIPTIGRIVHYVAYGSPNGEYPAGECRAAVITEVEDADKWEADDVPSSAWNHNVGLCVFSPTGFHFPRTVPRDQETKKPETWHWPEHGKREEVWNIGGADKTFRG